jgi:hypothetical protein
VTLVRPAACATSVNFEKGWESFLGVAAVWPADRR